jgi:hypothetical protein
MKSLPICQHCEERKATGCMRVRGGLGELWSYGSAPRVVITISAEKPRRYLENQLMEPYLPRTDREEVIDQACTLIAER